MNTHVTDLDFEDYIASLVVVSEDVTGVTQLDGARLFRVNDDHFVILVCTDADHRPHKGRALLERTFPRNWVCFARASNPGDDFDAYHYGPSADAQLPPSP